MNQRLFGLIWERLGSLKMFNLRMLLKKNGVLLNPSKKTCQIKFNNQEKIFAKKFWTDFGVGLYEDSQQQFNWGRIRLFKFVRCNNSKTNIIKNWWQAASVEWLVKTVFSLLCSFCHPLPVRIRPINSITNQQQQSYLQQYISVVYDRNLWMCSFFVLLFPI